MGAKFEEEKKASAESYLEAIQQDISPNENTLFSASGVRISQGMLDFLDEYGDEAANQGNPTLD